MKTQTKPNPKLAPVVSLQPHTPRSITTWPTPKPFPGTTTGQDTTATVEERLALLDELLALHKTIIEDEQVIIRATVRKNEHAGQFNALLSKGLVLGGGSDSGNRGACSTCNYEVCDCENLG